MASKYFTASVLELFDGDVALANDVNVVSDAVEAGFDIVLQDFAGVPAEINAAVGYATEWANKAEDSLISVAAGGDGADDYSSLHHATKANANRVLTNADVVLTGADVDSTNADVVLTHADVVLTGADVVLTGADVDSTNADVVLTHADVVLTGADVDSTNADVVLTHADVVLTGADVDSTNADVVLTGLDVALISGKAKVEINKLVASVNAVDVFIYDTSKDTDGGAWRERCSHLSWYNETLNTAARGATRKFPAVALLIARDTSYVYIYDATDDAVPMWMTFNRSSGSNVFGTLPTSLFMLNGKLVGGTAFGIRTVNFIGDSAYSIRSVVNVGSSGTYLGNISERDSAKAYDQISPTAIVNDTCNDVAMTVLPDSPIDPATGLQVPTEVVPTSTGGSWVKDDQTVIDATGAIALVDADIATTGMTVWASSSKLYIFNEIPTVDTALTSADYIFDTAGTTGPHISGGITSVEIAGNKILVGSSTGLHTIVYNKSTPAESMTSQATKDTSTGLMQGDTELCLSGENLTDKSVYATAVTGTATHAAVSTGAELQATTATSDLTATVTTGGQLEGWEYVGGAWLFRETIAAFVGASETTGTLTIANGTVFTLLKYTNGTGASTEQLEYIYNTEKKMFEVNSKITLAGTSDSVLALSYDDVTGLHHAMTSYGRSTFKDLVMVESEATTVGVPSCISAVGGNLAQGGSTGVDYYSPAETLRAELKRVDDQKKYYGSQLEAIWDLGVTSKVTFPLPVGWKPKFVYNAGALVKEGAADEYTVAFDGFIYSVVFAVAPTASNDLCFMSVRGYKNGFIY